MTGLTVTILGCGSSGGVPRIGNHWGVCDPTNPKNRRTRCSLLVERGSGDAKTSVLIDTSPDMAAQLNGAGTGRLDAVLYTHEHADQTHGIDDLRMVAINMRKRVPIWADQVTFDLLRSRFDYCFETPPGSGYPPILDPHVFDAELSPVTIEGAGGPITFLPFWQEHGHIKSLGFRFENIAYSSDLHDVPEESWQRLDGIDTWIVDALRYTPHPSHAHLERTLKWLTRSTATHGVLTNLHVDFDYETLKSELPPGIEPAYDGMILDR